MLSRSAERIYWLSRYMERTENTARLISVYMNLLMDLPRGIEMGWPQLIRIFGCDHCFYDHYKNASERNVTKSLLTEINNPSSLYSSLSAARENMRTTRELLPDEAWEQVNEIYLFTKENLDTISNRRGRVVFLNTVMEGCQRFTGLLSSYMSHNDAYRFIRIGRNIERADMTSRILELATLLLSEGRSQEMRQYESILWMNILQTLNALLMYRRHIRNRIKGNDVLRYLLQDTSLPRAILCCLLDIENAIDHLPNANGLPDKVAEFKTYVERIDTEHTTQGQLKKQLDHLQSQLGDLHNAIAKHWFDHANSGQSQIQS